MNLKIVSIVAAIGLLISLPQSATASLTSEQLTQQCRPQLEIMVQEFLSEDASADNPEKSRDQAGMRVNGINDPLVRQFVTEAAGEVANMSKPKLRQAIKELKVPLSEVTNSLGQGMDNAAGFVFLCIMEATLADLEGLPQPGIAAISSGTISPTPPAPPSASTAEAIPEGSTPDRYWLKGKVVNRDIESCEHLCPPIGLKLTVQTDDLYGSRLTGVLHASDFGFGPPMDPGTGWQIEDQYETEFYTCLPDIAGGIVVADERAINEAFAIPATTIHCRLNDEGKAFVKKARENEG